MMHYYGYRGSFFGPSFDLISLIFTIVFWALIIGLIVTLLRKHHNPEEEKEEKELVIQPNQYLDTIKRRYAEGEINKKEYEQLKKDLS